MASSMEKAPAMGKQLSLTGEKLAEFVGKMEPKYAAEMEREERRIEREMKQAAPQLQYKADKEAV